MLVFILPYLPISQNKLVSRILLDISAGLACFAPVVTVHLHGLHNYLLVIKRVGMGGSVAWLFLLRMSS